MQRFRAPFRLHHAPVLAPGAGAGGRRHIGLVLAAEHAARQRAVGHDAEPIKGGRRQLLDLGHAVHRVVIGLAHHRPGDPQAIGDAADLGDAPGAEIRETEVAYLALPHEIAHRPHGFLERRRMVLLVQVVDVEIVSAQPLQAPLRRLQDPFARQAALVGTAAHGVADLGREHPAVALACNDASGHFLGAALIVLVGGVDEVDAGLARAADDALGGRRIRRAAEHHGP